MTMTSLGILTSDQSQNIPGETSQRQGGAADAGERVIRFDKQ
ncbi:MAG TPA: hypothetical protein VEI25_20260 [Paraburkholderia sp.]|nr:hypothetical protein [Paraburkholderia sp.]